MKLNLTTISIFILAISVIAGALIISNSTSKEHNSEIFPSTQKGEGFLQKQLLNKEEASEYLGISVEEFDELDKIQFATFGQSIPYLETNSTKYYTIQSIEKWLADIDHYYWSN
ncbi:hypothetical protein [Peribacillus loiseleuriae]|uniref:hypothetical protein n=1 Tax=Peribacillus loiseleuriae TaxID=1679170 RepID=UPI003D06D557